jgi:hypothetical protein
LILYEGRPPMNNVPTAARSIGRFDKPAPRQTARLAPKLLVQVRDALRSRRYGRRTEETCIE